jgi:hypothetical protein
VGFDNFFALAPDHHAQDPVVAGRWAIDEFADHRVLNGASGTPRVSSRPRELPFVKDLRA